MPNTHSTLTALFTDIADAIREKDGTATQKVADAFPAAIRAIPSGGGTDVEDGIITGTISGEYTNSRITTIRRYAFGYCKNLTKVALPLCTSLASQAFAYCDGITTISLPVCTRIESYAFSSCYNLLSLYLTGSSVPSLAASNAFSATPIAGRTTSTGGVYGSIIVRASLLSAFQAAKNWSYYSSRFSVWNEVD